MSYMCVLLQTLKQLADIRHEASYESCSFQGHSENTRDARNSELYM
jgi:hypothetical protein